MNKLSINKGSGFELQF